MATKGTRGYESADATIPAGMLRPVTKANADLPEGICRSLNVGIAGTANLVDVTGELCTNYPLQAGYNPIQVRQVREGGTASDIWALY